MCQLKTTGGLSSVTVEELIAENASPGTIADHASICAKCGARANVEHAVHWKDFSKVAVLKIDRTLWEQHGDRWRSRKDARAVTIQAVLTLDSKMYKLKAAVVHMGQAMISGHYVTWVVDGKGYIQWNDMCATNHAQFPS